jgi:hypothetical protein
MHQSYTKKVSSLGSVKGGAAGGNVICWENWESLIAAVKLTKPDRKPKLTVDCYTQQVEKLRDTVFQNLRIAAIVPGQWFETKAATALTSWAYNPYTPARRQAQGPILWARGPLRLTGLQQIMNNTLWLPGLPAEVAGAGWTSTSSAYS